MNRLIGFKQKLQVFQKTVKQYMRCVLPCLLLFVCFLSEANEVFAQEVAPVSLLHNTQEGLSDTSFDHYYRLLSRLFYECPMRNQTEAIELAEDIYQHTKGWRKNQRTRDERLKTSANVDAFFKKLSEELLFLRVDWQNDKLECNGPQEIAVVRGIERFVLLQVINTSNTSLSGILKTDPVDPYPWSAIQLAPGESIYLLTKLIFENDGANSFRIILDDTGGNTREVTLPVLIQEPALLRGSISDDDTKTSCPARVYVLCDDHVYRHTKPFADEPTLTEKPVIFRPAMWKVPFSYTQGEFEILVPPGKTEVTVERGFESEIVTKTISLAPGETGQVSFNVRRFIDMKEQGWISGDTHVHWVKNSWDINEDLDLLAMVQRAEDVRVINNLTLFQWTPNGPFIKPDHFPMGPVPGYCSNEYHIQMGEEYRNDNIYGHINLLGIKEIVQPVATGRGSGGDENAIDYPTNKTAIDNCHAQGGIYCEAHGLGPFENGDTAVNAVLGLADCIDQLDAPYYYRLLNCGVRVPLGNGSDHPARLVGCARTYVKVQPHFTYDAWLDGIRAGRTFVTSGPLLVLKVNGSDVGSVLELKQGEPIKIELNALSRYPLGNLQIVSNGEVIKSVTTQDKSVSMSFDTTADKSRWFVARCSPNDEYTMIRTAEDYHTARPHIAHTSAVYVHVAGRPVFIPEDAEFWLDRFQRHLEEIRTRGHFQNAEQREEAMAHVQEGIKRLQALLHAHKTLIP